MQAKGLADAEFDIGIFFLIFTYDSGNVMVNMPAGIKKIQQDNNLPCPSLDASQDALRDTGLFNLKEGINKNSGRKNFFENIS